MPSYRARLTIGLGDSMTGETLQRTAAIPEPPCDFLAHLAERLKLEGAATLDLLGQWLNGYEPRRRPSIHFSQSPGVRRAVENPDECDSLAVA
jgi:hypothetical protein